MSKTAEEIAILALEEIGEFSPVDQGVDATKLRRTLQRLHQNVAVLAATNNLIFDVKTTVRIPLTADKADYDFVTDVTDGDVPATGIQFIHAAHLHDDQASTVQPIAIKFVDEFEGIYVPSQQGWPTCCTILRNISEIRFWPVPGSTGVKTVHLTVQEYGPNLDGIENAKNKADLSDAWTRWAVLETAYAVSGGVVRKLQKSDRDDLRDNAEILKNRLLAYENRMHGTEPVVDYSEYV